MGADWVYVLTNRKFVEQETHRALLQQRGLYSNLSAGDRVLLWMTDRDICQEVENHT